MMANFHSFAASAGQQIQSRFTFKKSDAGERDIISGNDLYTATPLLTTTKQAGKVKTTGYGSSLPGRIYEPLISSFLFAGFALKETGNLFDHHLLYIFPFHYFW